jgi:hypothetical protein
VSRIISSNKALLLSSASSNFKKSVSMPFSDNNINFEKTDSKSDVHFALGKCNAVGKLVVEYRKSGRFIEVSKVNCYGTLSDLYDWAYGSNLSLFGLKFDLTKYAARTQAGHATLTSRPHQKAGRVFFTEVNFASGWKEWSNKKY